MCFQIDPVRDVGGIMLCVCARGIACIDAAANRAGIVSFVQAVMPWP